MCIRDRFLSERENVSKQIVRWLTKHYDIDTVEKCLIKIFLATRGIYEIKNKFVREYAEDVPHQELRKIADYLAKKRITVNFSFLLRTFELMIDPKFRKLNGAFYTPKFVVEYINKRVLMRPDEGIRVCDPACGSGAFLIDAVKRISDYTKRPIAEVIQRNIYGVDIDPRSVKRTKLLLSLLAIINGQDKKKFDFHIKVGDSLAFNWRKEFREVFRGRGFDCVIGNPPYVRIQNLEEDVRERIQREWETASFGNIDLFIPFFELGINLLSPEGILGYITPNTYFHSKAGKKLREFLLKNTLIEKIIDFNHLQIFEDVTTYTCISILTKTRKDFFKYALVKSWEDLKKLDSLKFKPIKYALLDSNRWLLLEEFEYKLVKRIETIGIPLRKLARISVGIATLADDVYIIENPEEVGGYYIKIYNGKQYKIEKEITKEIIKANTLKNEKDVINNKTRIIFPYKKVDGKYVIIPENELKKKYPECYKYFQAVRHRLERRDKGKKKYVTWYAYGRTQGINNGFGKKILTPAMARKPTFVICEKEDALFYGGYGIFYSGDLEVLSKVLNSKVMEFYINKTSRYYQGGYRSYAKIFIQNFSIPEFTREEIEFLKKEKSKERIDNFLMKKYFGNTNIDLNFFP